MPDTPARTAGRDRGGIMGLGRYRDFPEGKQRGSRIVLKRDLDVKKVILGSIGRPL